MRQYVEFSGRDMKGLCSPNKISRLAASTREAEPNRIWAPGIEPSICLDVPEEEGRMLAVPGGALYIRGKLEKTRRREEREENEAVNA